MLVAEEAVEIRDLRRRGKSIARASSRRPCFASSRVRLVVARSSSDFALCLRAISIARSKHRWVSGLSLKPIISSNTGRPANRRSLSKAMAATSGSRQALPQEARRMGDDEASAYFDVDWPARVKCARLGFLAVECIGGENHGNGRE
jgi:hypothetical protein